MPKCKICDSFFPTYGKPAQVCSDGCRAIRQRELRNYAYARNKGKVIIPLEDRIINCSICEKDFTPKVGMQKYCGFECNKKAEKLRNNKRKCL